MTHLLARVYDSVGDSASLAEVDGKLILTCVEKDHDDKGDAIVTITPEDKDWQELHRMVGVYLQEKDERERQKRPDGVHDV